MALQDNKRTNFGSRLGAILAAAGSAVGLGNIWRFPCETGANGGAAFLIVYIVCILLIAVPVLIAEIGAGRAGRANAFDTYRKLADSSSAGFVGKAIWNTAGAMCVIAGFLVFAYYSVVAGWTLYYTVIAATGEISHGGGAAFGMFISDPVKPTLSLIAFIVITTGIVLLGVQKGIERGSKIMMPMLFILLIVLAICSMSLPNASKGLEFLFKPDFSKVTTEVWLSAMGQAFFTLSIGIGTLMTYASYFSEKVNIVKDSFHVVTIDTCVAILAGLVIFPAALSVGVSPDTGPTLVFITLPKIFQMAFGDIPLLQYTVTLLFYILLVMAALTSSISMLEITTVFVSERFKLKRKTAALILAVLTAFAAFCCSMSFGNWSDVKLFGMNIFDLFDFAVAKFAMPLGGIFLCFLMKRMGQEKVVAMLTNSGSLRLGKFPVLFYRLITTLIPALIFVIFINELFR